MTDANKWEPAAHSRWCAKHGADPKHPGPQCDCRGTRDVDCAGADDAIGLQGLCTFFWRMQAPYAYTVIDDPYCGRTSDFHEGSFYGSQSKHWGAPGLEPLYAHPPAPVAAAEAQIPDVADIRTTLGFVFGRFCHPDDAGEVPDEVVAAVRRLERAVGEDTIVIPAKKYALARAIERRSTESETVAAVERAAVEGVVKITDDHIRQAKKFWANGGCETGAVGSIAAHIAIIDDLRCKLTANTEWQVVDGYVLIPKEPTAEMIEQGAQALAQWEDGSAWPGSWSPLQVAGMRNDARKAYISMIEAAGNGH